jgi:hypothetical protein
MHSIFSSCLYYPKKWRESFVTLKRNSYDDSMVLKAPVAVAAAVVVAAAAVAISPKCLFDNEDMCHAHPTTLSHIAHETNVCSITA